MVGPASHGCRRRSTSVDVPSERVRRIKERQHVDDLSKSMLRLARETRRIRALAEGLAADPDRAIRHPAAVADLRAGRRDRRALRASRDEKDDHEPDAAHEDHAGVSPETARRTTRVWRGPRMRQSRTTRAAAKLADHPFGADADRTRRTRLRNLHLIDSRDDGLVGSTPLVLHEARYPRRSSRERHPSQRTEEACVDDLRRS